jgi:hypothetical protein
MRGFRQAYIRGASGLLAFAGAAFGGLHCSRWIDAGRADRAPDVRIPATPDPAVVQTWIDLIEGARSTIWLAAGRIQSEAILAALDRAARRGVAVHLTLSPPRNPSPDSGARLRLRRSTWVRDVRVSSFGFDGAACAVDGRTAVVTGQGLLAGEEAAADSGCFLFAADPGIAGKLEARLAEQHAQGADEAR